MATQSIGAFPTPMPAIARILARFDRPQIEAFLAVAIDLLDTIDPDPDAEEEPLEDAFVKHDAQFAEQFEADTSWTEHHTRGRHKLAMGTQELFDPTGEDSEESDDDSCLAGDDRGTATFADDSDGLPGCPMDAEEGGDREEDRSDTEQEQMLDDVPVLPVVTLAHNLFNDQRQPLGLSNLLTSFRSGSPTRSADTGEILPPIREHSFQPGEPV